MILLPKPYYIIRDFKSALNADNFKLHFLIEYLKKCDLNIHITLNLKYDFQMAIKVFKISNEQMRNIIIVLQMYSNTFIWILYKIIIL